jgi:hypothetical protein
MTSSPAYHSLRFPAHRAVGFPILSEDPTLNRSETQFQKRAIMGVTSGRSARIL